MLLHYFERLPWWRRLWHTLGSEYNSGTMPIPPSKQSLFSITEAAARLGMTRQRVHQLIKDGRLKAQRHGKVWLIPESEIEELQSRIKPTGRPRKY